MLFGRKLKGKHVIIPDDLKELLDKYDSELRKIQDERYDAVISKEDKVSLSNKLGLSDEEILANNFADIDETIKKLDEGLKKLEEVKTFRDVLFELIDERGLKDSIVYKKAYIDRRLFSKIRCDKYYHPTFGTIVLFGLALELPLKEFEDLLFSAGYSLPKNNKENIVIRFLFEHNIYDVKKANNILFSVCGKNIKEL